MLLACAILFGVLPYHTVLKYMDPTIDRQVQDLTDWTRTVKDPIDDSATSESTDDQAAVSTQQQSAFEITAVGEADQPLTGGTKGELVDLSPHPAESGP